VHVPEGRTDVKVRVGIGEATVRLPADACVTTAARLGAGQADLLDDSHRGADLSVSEGGDAASVLHLDANVGVGHLQLMRTGGGTGCT
jgi:hypothetical protein